MDIPAGLIEGGAPVEMCALLLPNSEWKLASLMDGVGVATPQEAATARLRPRMRVLSF
ncbi:hypothetical protein [Ideonella sp. A 288]|uniref:hypothetical protein n=1 Tax=Ideonella sp. A 288 TaxID=1962181 RepID=UPI001303585F|nr:hypothetical protein [Ideonella sp. A 288]